MDLGEIKIEVNPYLPDDTVVLQREVFKYEDLKFPLKPFEIKLWDEIELDVYRYSAIGLPSVRKYIDIHSILNMSEKEFRGRIKKLLSFKYKRRLQRKLDIKSNVRRRKRYLELLLRRKRKIIEGL
jgi:hypothetical protein